MQQTIEVLKHVPFYYFRTWNYINGNGLTQMGKIAHNKDYHKFIYELSQQMYQHPEVHHFNTRRSLWGMIQDYFENHVIKQEDIIQLPTLQCSLYITGRWLFKEYYKETEVFSKEQWEIIHKLACLIHHGVYTYNHETERLNEKIKYGEVRKQFTKHVDPTKLLIREKNKRITTTRIRPLHYKTDEKWEKVKAFWENYYSDDDYETGRVKDKFNKKTYALNKYHGASRNNPILLKRILDGIDLTLMDEPEGEDDRDTFYQDWIEPQIQHDFIMGHEVGDDEHGTLVNDEANYVTGEEARYLIIPHINKTGYPTPFYNKHFDWNDLMEYYNTKHKNLFIPFWDLKGIRLALMYLCSINEDVIYFKTGDKNYTQKQIRIYSIPKDRWNFHWEEIEKEFIGNDDYQQ